MMRRLLLLPLLLLSSSCTSEPAPCAVWQVPIAIADGSINGVGPVAASNGARVLVAWQESRRSNFAKDVKIALLDPEDGAVIVPATSVTTTSVEELQVAGGAAGFLLLAYISGSDVQAFTVSADGTLGGGATVLPLAETACAVADDEGVTILGGSDIVRLDYAGVEVGRSSSSDFFFSCSAVVATRDGQGLAIGRLSSGNRQVFVDFSADASSFSFRDSDGLPKEPLALARDDDRLLLLSRDVPDRVQVTLLDLDGARVQRASTIATVADDEELPVDGPCPGRCRYLSLSSTPAGALATWQSFSTGPLGGGHIAVRGLRLAEEGDDVVVGAQDTIDGASAAGGEGGLLTWLDLQPTDVRTVMVRQSCDLAAP